MCELHVYLVPPEALGPLELESQTAVSHHGVAEKSGSCAKPASALDF